MKIILQRPVDNLGSPGDVADVADGYARNYLIPRGLAVKATKNMVNHADSLRRAHSKREYARKGEFEALASKIIADGPIVVRARAGDEGRLFGSVTAEHIAEAVSARAETPIDKRDVRLTEPIRSVGTHEVKIHLFTEVEPIITVEVEPES
jgi:large subunit ribosomal protein L9